MATVIWVGNAAAVAQVTSITIGGTPGTGNTYSVKIGFGSGKTVTYTALVSDTNTTIATNLCALLAASLYPEFREISWSNPSAGVIYATALTAGIPFTLSTSTSGTGTPTAATATVTANSGPNDLSLGANYSTGSLPSSTDSLYFQGTNVSAFWGLDALAAVAPALVQIDASFTGSIGLPVNNSNGYREYRQRFVQFAGATLVNIGQGSGTGSPKVQLDFQAHDFTLNLFKAATSNEPGMPAVQIKGGNGASTINANKGTLGLALLAGETANVTNLNINYVNNPKSDAVVTAGAGCTLSSVKMSGGKLTAYCTVPTFSSTGGGSATVYSGNMTTATLQYDSGTQLGSTLNYLPAAGGTITNYSIGKNCVLDCSATEQAITLTGNGAGPTTGTVYAGGTVNAPDGNVTMTNPFTIPDGQVSDITLNLGSNRTVKVV